MFLSDLKPGQVFSGIVKVVGKRTPGPVVLRVTDGTFSMEAAARAVDVEVGDIVELTGPAMRRLGKIQIEIKSIQKTSKPLPSVEETGGGNDAVLVVKTVFNETRLKPLLIQAARRIKQAILSDQPVILRHHADADGSSGGILIEKALQDLCRSRGMKPEQYVYRMPSKLPWYDVGDAVWDASFSKKVIESRGLSAPLIINIDNGSTEEDVFGLKLMNALGFSLMVIDHHNPGPIKEGKVAVDPFLEVHVNPLLVGGSYWSCSGMLCYEIAHLINPKIDLPVIPALAAVADRSESEEGHEYIRRSGKSMDELKDLALCFDFLPYHLRNDHATGVFDAVLENPDAVKVITDEINSIVERQLAVLIPSAVIHKLGDQGDISLVVCDLSKLGERFSFPPAGKLTGQVHDHIKEEALRANDKAKVMTLGLVPGLVIVRASEPFLPVSKIIESFHKAKPHILISGGGHDVAGTIKCPPGDTQTVIEFIRKSLQGLHQPAP